MYHLILLVIKCDLGFCKANNVKTNSQTLHKSIDVDIEYRNDVFFLQDLSHYNYDLMVTQSMMLLDRYYSSYDNLFNRAVQAQVCVSDRWRDILFPSLLLEFHVLRWFGNKYMYPKSTDFYLLSAQQVLITDKSVSVLNELRKIIPVMNQMVSSKLTQDQTKIMIDILQKLIGYVSEREK